MISLPEFSPTTNPKLPSIVAFLNSSGVLKTVPYFRQFPSTLLEIFDARARTSLVSLSDVTLSLGR